MQKQDEWMRSTGQEMQASGGRVGGVVVVREGSGLGLRKRWAEWVPKMQKLQRACGCGCQVWA